MLENPFFYGHAADEVLVLPAVGAAGLPQEGLACLSSFEELLVAPAPPHDDGVLSAWFEQARGNEWWVEIDVGSPSSLVLVEARVNEGPWQALWPTEWGSWAASFFVASGSLVEFRATSSTNATALSGVYEWPSGTLVSPPPASDDPSPPTGGQLEATFENARGNNWWVEIEVSAAAPLALVEARINGGPWRGLPPSPWGSWAASIFVEVGSVVHFRATSTAGDTALSGGYQWPSANPVDGQ